MRPIVFVHTNAKQHVGALVSAYSFRRNSPTPEAFDVRIIQLEDTTLLDGRDGQPYLRGGTIRRWRSDDLQSFTLLRFLPPELMGYTGRALLVDPDVFAVGDVMELLGREMGGKAILCRERPPGLGRPRYFASSVMLLDCAKLRHWTLRSQIDELFLLKRDYIDWMRLKLDPRESIGTFEPAWNDFDHLTPQTKLLHTTRRRTQPWKTGLPIDFQPPDRPLGIAWLGRADGLRRRFFGDYAFRGRYRRHPDHNQERLFFVLLKECLEGGALTEATLRREIALGHLRPDAMELVEGIAQAA